MQMKTVLITGGTSGIGLELVKLFIKDAYQVVVASRSKRMPPDPEYKNVVYIQSDLSEPGSAKKLHAQLESRNISIEVLVNNAGFGDFGDFALSDLSRQTDMIQLNVATLTELTHLLLPNIIDSKGKILLVASTAAFVPGPYMSVYYATKHYVLAFAEALSEELKNKGVSVTALCPGPTSTNFKKAAHIKGASLFNGALPSAKEVAAYGYSELQKGKVIAVHGWRNKCKVILLRLLPKSLARRVSAKYNMPAND
jgi:uncharacterized protein